MSKFQQQEEDGIRMRAVVVGFVRNADQIDYLERLEWLLVYTGICLSQYDEFQQVRPELLR